MENVCLTELPGDQKNRKPLCDIQINADNVTTNLYTNTQEFKEYLESFMHEELYKLVTQDVFSILPPDTTLDMVVSQVTEYLKSDTATLQLSPVAVRESRTHGQLILRSVKRVFHYLRILLHLRIKFAVGRSVCGLHWPFTLNLKSHPLYAKSLPQVQI
ncbi:hypothetical protein EB796_010600 [Bugula neritina]|uniref:Uncharacterized protein n=1 Tax=Bugula neritina TaxID=10212 RepID=A0A7J7JZJ2_BUGNE|nr:hypothetical protein EB796_010600 [Bugula neritina]